jgi:hypothetical protein
MVWRHFKKIGLDYEAAVCYLEVGLNVVFTRPCPENGNHPFPLRLLALLKSKVLTWPLVILATTGVHYSYSNTLLAGT